MRARMAELPTGTVTLLFTDIEGSTQLLHQLDDRYATLLAMYRELLRTTFQSIGGHEVDTQGDAFFAAFHRAADAVMAAATVQQVGMTHPWPDGVTLRMRIGLHTGEPVLADEGYVGLDVHLAARLSAAGNGGQVLLSETTRALVEHDLATRSPAGMTLRDLGVYHLKDLQYPERIFQLVIPGLPADFPPLRTFDARPHNLPVQRTPLIGRERELATVRSMLMGQNGGLITLTGPGGTGKTRLSVQIAADLLDDFADGVFFVDLSPIDDPTLVASTIAVTCGVRETPGQLLVDSLKDYLRDRQLLLVLDNFEQVLAAAPLVTDLLQSAPRLKILVTSRARLHVRGEREVAVPPLAVPDPKQLPSSEMLSQYEAVRLFIARAQEAKPGFAVTNANAPAIAEICVRLDGLPLAIELAAARTKLLTPQAILARLSSRLNLLTGGARDLPVRQQTLRGAIDWSYSLLDEGEQMLFRRLGVFVGGCTVEATEAVCNPDGDLPIDVLDGLQSLLDKSLLRQGGGGGGELRFRRLETIREYAVERLQESGETDRLQRQHANFYLALAEEAEPQLDATERGIWLARLEAEHDNVRAALTWSLHGGDVVIGVRLAAALWRFWERRGYFTEGRSWLERVLEEGHSAPADFRAPALLRAGEAAAIQGDHARAVEPIEASIRLLQGLGDTSGVARGMSTLGITLRDLGDYPRATVLLEVAMEVHRFLGNTYGIAVATNMLGCIARNQGDYARAHELLHESLRLYREIHHTQGIAAVFHDLGELAQRQGDDAEATALYSQSIALYRQLGIQVMIAWSLHNQAYLHEHQGDVPGARAHFQESLRIFHRLGTKDGTVACLTGLARTFADAGDALRAARLLAAAEVLNESRSGVFVPIYAQEYERTIAIVRNQIDAATYAAAWAEGRAMPPEQAVADALGEGAR